MRRMAGHADSRSLMLTARAMRRLLIHSQASIWTRHWSNTPVRSTSLPTRRRDTPVDVAQTEQKSGRGHGSRVGRQR